MAMWLLSSTLCFSNELRNLLYTHTRIKPCAMTYHHFSAGFVYTEDTAKKTLDHNIVLRGDPERHKIMFKVTYIKHAGGGRMKCHFQDKPPIMLQSAH